MLDSQIGQVSGKVAGCATAEHNCGQHKRSWGRGQENVLYKTRHIEVPREQGLGEVGNEEDRLAEYTEEHARAGVKTKLPELETWPNQFPGYVITTRYPEYSSICPKTGLPDYGTITIRYMPKKDCIELKALKMYLLAYRDLGIFYENAVNKILHDIVDAVRPEWCVVRGEFTPRGGLTTSIFARWPERSPIRKSGSKARSQRGKAR